MVVVRYYKIVFVFLLSAGLSSILGNSKQEQQKKVYLQERYINCLLIASFFGYWFGYKLIIPYFYHEICRRIEIGLYWRYLTKSYVALSCIREDYNNIVKGCLHQNKNTLIVRILQQTIDDFSKKSVETLITKLHVIEEAKEDKREEGWSVLPYKEQNNYTILYDPDIPEDILHYARVLFDAFELNFTFKILYVVRGNLAQSKRASMSSVFNKREQWCGIYISSRVIKEFKSINNCMKLVNQLIHEMCHIKHEDPSASMEIYAKARANEFRAESWIPENYCLFAKLRFFGIIEELFCSSDICPSIQYHKAYPSLLEKYVTARTLYRYVLNDPNDFSGVLYDVCPELLQLDGKLMSLYYKNEEKMLFIPQLLENIRNQKRSLIKE